MKRIILLTVAIFFVGQYLGSVALAQDITVINGITKGGGDTIASPLTIASPTTGLGTCPPTRCPLAPSGGPSILLPSAALLLGTGVLTYAFLRRRG